MPWLYMDTESWKPNSGGSVLWGNQVNFIRRAWIVEIDAMRP